MDSSVVLVLVVVLVLESFGAQRVNQAVAGPCGQIDCHSRTFQLRQRAPFRGRGRERFFAGPTAILEGEYSNCRNVSVGMVASAEVSIVYRWMFSHVVIFWTDPAKPDAPGEVIAAAKKYLPSIPGIVNFHVGSMATSHRDIVDQTYQVALNIQFQSKQAQDEYQDHPQHLEFVKQCRPLFAKLIIYDFE